MKKILERSVRYKEEERKREDSGKENKRKDMKYVQSSVHDITFR